MAKKQGPKNANLWGNVVIAILSVNQYSALSLAEDLDANGLFDLRNLAAWDHAEIYKRLEQSGYKRGEFLTGSMTERLISLGKLAENFQENDQILANGNKGEVTALLSKVKGIGPLVLSNVLALRDLKMFTSR
jgi:hypothetical protein